jgi:hypothetical protein
LNNALIIEPYTPDTYVFINGLHDLTHCRIRHNQTIEEGLRTMEQTYCDVILVTMTSQSPPAQRVVEQIRSRAADLFVRPPEVILLFNNSLPVSDALRCRELGGMSNPLANGHRKPVAPAMIRRTLNEMHAMFSGYTLSRALGWYWDEAENVGVTDELIRCEIDGTFTGIDLWMLNEWRRRLLRRFKQKFIYMKMVSSGSTI